MKKLLLSLLILSSAQFTSLAQNTHQNLGWLVYTHHQKLSDNWSIGADFQLRSAPDYKYLKNVLFRPGVNYALGKKLSISIGYVYLKNYIKPVKTKSSTLEQMTWEQISYNSKIKSVAMMNRLRIEQRFIEGLNEDVFSQRLRYALQFQVPLKKMLNNKFEKGIYLGLQNEIFFHIQNKEHLNNHFFDQNRTYLSLGYRFSPSVDLEGGYLKQSSKLINNNYNINNIAQIILKTRFGTPHHHAN